MKKIFNLASQRIILEGFGVIEVEETTDGKWKLDLFPRESDNDEDKILFEVCLKPYGDKYFSAIESVRKVLNKPCSD